MKKTILSILTAIMLPLSACAQDIEELLPKAQKGDVKAMVELAEAYANSWDDGADAKAVKWYTKAADSGSGDAMFKLYEAYNYGSLGLDTDENAAKKWLDKAVAKGNAEALYTKGTALFYDDDANGIKLVIKGGENGSANAQYWLANHYNDKWSDEYSPAKAFSWAQKAANLNLAEAQYLLGTFYLKGIGTSANKPEALKWLKKAAENDYSTAVEILEWL